MRADLAYTSKFSPRWHHKESDTANLAADVSDDTIDHLGNTAESTGVDSAAAGLGHGASVTFTDAADHQAVDVAGNGSYAAGLTDRMISSSLPAIDGAGPTTTAAGNSVLLDTGKGPSP